MLRALWRIVYNVTKTSSYEVNLLHGLCGEGYMKCGT